MNGRLVTLDYLRGLCAFGIMVYHYLYWLEGPMSANQFMGRVGVYGVSIFYVLSGLTLFHVYEYSQSDQGFSVLSFFKKRFFRIFPLLWLATICAVIISKKQPDPLDLFLNLTGLFGFFSWDGTFATGAWSIGNELVFYSIFPLILYSCMRNRVLLIGILASAAALHHYFAFHILHPDAGLAEQWHDYVNPLNQIFLFTAGCVIGLMTKRLSFSPIAITCIVVSGIALFIVTPAEGNNIHLVSGWNRWIFTCSCLLICIGAYKLEIPLLGKIDTTLKLLGESSYSVYMLHALVFSVTAYPIKILQNSGFALPMIFKMIIPIAITLSLSYVVYVYFEKYFIRLGSRISEVKSK